MPSLPARVSLTAALAATTVGSTAVPAFAQGATALDARAVARPAAVSPVRTAPQSAPAVSVPQAPAAMTYQVQPGDSVWAIAQRTGTSVRAIVDANGLDAKAFIRAGQMLTIPSPVGVTAPAAPTSAATHTIVRGDTLSGIAARYGTTVTALMNANGLNSTTIYAGRVLQIPGASAAATPAAAPAATPQLVPNTFLHYTYPEATVSAANVNKAALLNVGVPTRDEMRSLVRSTAVSMGVDPALALAIAMKESGFNHASVSPANAIGTMQVIPSSGAWASDLVGRKLNLLDPRDNVTAGVAIIRQLVRTSSSLDIAIASYYQGAGSVKRNGMFSDTKSYVASVKSYMAQFRG